MIFFFFWPNTFVQGGGSGDTPRIIFDQFSRHFSQFGATLIFFHVDAKISGGGGGGGGFKKYFCFIFLLVGPIVSGMTSFSFVMLFKTTIPAGGWPAGWGYDREDKAKLSPV